jgi:hypothetical protein
MDKVLAVMMVVTALLTLWSVTTSNHLFVG